MRAYPGARERLNHMTEPSNDDDDHDHVERESKHRTPESDTDPRDTDHPAGEEHAAANIENEPPG